MGTLNKAELLDHCKARVAFQVQELHAAIEKVKESIDNEQKSSAGDKFETSRAMAQKEMELLAIQHQKALNDLGILEKLNPDIKHEHIQLGSLVETKSKWLFIATAMGKVTFNDEHVFVVSPTSPIGQVLLGNRVGFKYSLGPNNDEITALH